VKRRFWTALDDAELRDLYPRMKTEKVAALIERSLEAVYGRAGILGLHKTATYLASPDACRLRRADNPGIRYRYPKGHVPANKGLRRPGYAPGRMAQTQFRKGQANHNLMPLGATRLIDGYVYVKVAAVKYVPYYVNWKLVHVLNWERANGRPLPDAHCLIFRDGNRKNVETSNLELMTRAENMRRNTLHRYPKDIVHAIQLRGALNRKINRMERERAEHA